MTVEPSLLFFPLHGSQEWNSGRTSLGSNCLCPLSQFTDPIVHTSSKATDALPGALAFSHSSLGALAGRSNCPVQPAVATSKPVRAT